jgi:hypothetical protein
MHKGRDEIFEVFNVAWSCVVSSRESPISMNIQIASNQAVDVMAQQYIFKPAHRIVIKEFHPKEGTREGAEKVLSSCYISLLHFPCFPSSKREKPCILRLH